MVALLFAVLPLLAPSAHAESKLRRTWFEVERVCGRELSLPELKDLSSTGGTSYFLRDILTVLDGTYSVRTLPGLGCELPASRRKPPSAYDPPLYCQGELQTDGMFREEEGVVHFFGFAVVAQLDGDTGGKIIMDLGIKTHRYEFEVVEKVLKLSTPDPDICRPGERLTTYWLPYPES